MIKRVLVTLSLAGICRWLLIAKQLRDAEAAEYEVYYGGYRIHHDRGAAWSPHSRGAC